MKIIQLLLLFCFSICLQPYSAQGAVDIRSEAEKRVNSKMPQTKAEYDALSKREKRKFKRTMRKKVKKELKQLKKDLKSGALESDEMTILLVILAILLPPLAVFLYEGEATVRFWLSLILTLLFWIPGVIYALLVILGGI